jgi:prohibitin 2
MEEKIKEFSSKIGKGGMPGAPKGLGLGVKLLAAGAAAVYGVQQSMYTGIIKVNLS